MPGWCPALAVRHRAGLCSLWAASFAGGALIGDEGAGGEAGPLQGSLAASGHLGWELRFMTPLPTSPSYFLTISHIYTKLRVRETVCPDHLSK